MGGKGVPARSSVKTQGALVDCLMKIHSESPATKMSAPIDLTIRAPKELWPKPKMRTHTFSSRIFDHWSIG